jgi:solute carrier family 25 (mitochondrial carnitine/acylcarnitine transporter), member 20/29
MQALESSSALQIAKQIYTTEGFQGLYRGGIPLALGGGLMRSAQFGCFEQSIYFLQQTELIPSCHLFGFLNPQVALAGFIGGIGRGLVEGPFEFIKVRRQIDKPWKVREVFTGSSATIFRNSFLFSSFMIYVDISKLLLPNEGLSPFWTGAICSNLAWLTIWPLDVAKSQLQSGRYEGKGYGSLIGDLVRSGKLFRGVLPGLMRSTLANGLSMMVYKQVEGWLREGGERAKKERDC